MTSQPIPGAIVKDLSTYRHHGQLYADLRTLTPKELERLTKDPYWPFREYNAAAREN